MAHTYKFVARSPNAEHGHPFLVYDCTGRLHYELTRFAKLAMGSLSQKTVKGYLYAVFPFFTWMDTDQQQVRGQWHWQDTPERVRWAIEDYLVEQMSCQVQPHHLGFQLIRPTTKTPSQARMFLVSLKCFYRLMRQYGYYSYANPLVDSLSEIFQRVEECLEEPAQIPRMPEVSGVQERHGRQRLTDSYYKFVGEEWVPQIIDDPNFPRQVLEGGHQLQGWSLREECVTRLLFETGGRVSEITGLTLGDWAERGMKCEANTFSKGSNGRRVKFIRFSSDTAKLLRRYFDKERIKYDPNGYTLEHYSQFGKNRHLDLHTVPLFLTCQKSPFSPENYRNNYWKPACEASGLDADVHQTRHWYVTMAVRKIYEGSTTEVESNRRLQELQEYMKWKSSKTITAYEHYFDAARHSDIQDCVHARMDEVLKQNLHKRQQVKFNFYDAKPSESTDTVCVEALGDSDFNYLRKIGGSSHGS